MKKWLKGTVITKGIKLAMIKANLSFVMPGYEVIGEEEKNATLKIFEEGGAIFHRSFENKRKHFYVREFNTNVKTTSILLIVRLYLALQQ